MVDLEPLVEADDIDFVQVALMKHVTLTGSRYAARLLEDWATLQRRIVKVMPREYKQALAAEAKRAPRGRCVASRRRWRVVAIRGGAVDRSTSAGPAIARPDSASGSHG